MVQLRGPIAFGQPTRTPQEPPMPIEVAPDPLAPPTERLAAPPVLFSPSDFADAAGAYTDFRRSPEGDVDAWVRAFDDAGPAELFRALHHKSPTAALQLASAAARMPEAGDEFAGFRLVHELGRGAFGRVFMAEQPELSDRQVVLKVTLDARAEVKALARLLHTNIVPVYSVHRSGLYQAVCMPYCGSTTLADAIRRFRGETLPESGKGLVTLLQLSAASGRPPASSSEPSGSSPPGPSPSSDTLIVHQPSSKAVLDLLGGLSYVD